MNIRFTVSYMGGSFHGFQAQDTGKAVQNYLYTSIYTALRLKNKDEKQIHMNAAGRTDTGVHAFGQVINFQLNWYKALQEGFTLPFPIDDKNISKELKYILGIKIDPASLNKSASYYHRILKENEKGLLQKVNSINSKQLQKLSKSLNALLPDDINVRQALIVPSFFHARFSCLYRLYNYYVLNSNSPQAFWKDRALHVPKKLNLENIQKAIVGLTGEKDFAAFTKVIYKEERTHRYMEEISIQALHDFPDILVFSFKASGFLHNMIRILLSSLLQVGSGKQNIDYVRKLMLSKDRTIGPATAKPHGLYFVEAGYNKLNHL